MKFPVLVESDCVNIVLEPGLVEHADIMETLDFVADHFCSHRNRKLIIIDRGSDYSPSKNQMRQYIDMIHLLHQGAFSRIALVVTKTFHFGLGRMAEGLADPAKGQFRVFRDETKARNWLSS